MGSGFLGRFRRMLGGGPGSGDEPAPPAPQLQDRASEPEEAVADKRLVAALRDPDFTVARRAARELGDSGDPEAVDALVTALEGTDLDIRREAAKSLGKIGDARAVPALIAALTDSRSYRERHVPLEICASNADARIEAAWALGEIGDPRAIEALVSVKHLQLRGYYRGCTLAEAAEAALAKLSAPAEAPPGASSEDALIEGLLSPAAGERERAIAAVEERRQERSDELDRAYRASCRLRDAIGSSGATQQRLVEEAIELAPSFSAAMSLLSNIYQYEHASREEALAWATKAVAADTGDWLAWIQLGRVQVAMGNAVEAARAYAESVRINPEVEGGLRSEPYAYLLPVYERLKMTEQASDAEARVRDGGTRLAAGAEQEWRALVAAASEEALADALTGR